jgi:hypothetical protein
MAEVERKFVDVAHQGIKFANVKTTSVLEGAFMNYSATATFNPLRALNPGETTAATIARVLATLIHDLNVKRVI